jgi:hypothetical protein
LAAQRVSCPLVIVHVDESSITVEVGRRCIVNQFSTAGLVSPFHHSAGNGAVEQIVTAPLGPNSAQFQYACTVPATGKHKVACSPIIAAVFPSLTLSMRPRTSSALLYHTVIGHLSLSGILLVSPAPIQVFHRDERWERIAAEDGAMRTRSRYPVDRPPCWSVDDSLPR